MSFLKTGVIATSRKVNEARLPIHPQHLERISPEVRSALVFEQGYGEPFGFKDETIRSLGFGLADRREILAGQDIVILPKLTAADLLDTREGSILWGWPHCVQQRDVTQAAIDHRLTLIAWEAMYHWGSLGERQIHTFYKNNEMAGYCSVLHALDLLGWDGFYGPRRSCVVLGFGSVSRGAIFALQGRGFHEIEVYTQRPPYLVRDQIFGCRYRQMRRTGETDGSLLAVNGTGSEQPLLEVLEQADILVNGTLQDTDRPLDYLQPGEEDRLIAGSLIVDVSCDEGMGFPFARPTSFESPLFKVGSDEQVTYYGVDHSPSYLWEGASWEISKALLPYLESVMSGPAAWTREPTLERAIEIREGVIQNPKILSFQNRDAEYPHGSVG